MKFSLSNVYHFDTFSLLLSCKSGFLLSFFLMFLRLSLSKQRLEKRQCMRFFSLPDIKAFLDGFSKEVSIFFWRPSLTHLLFRFSFCFEPTKHLF